MASTKILTVDAFWPLCQIIGKMAFLSKVMLPFIPHQKKGSSKKEICAFIIWFKKHRKYTNDISFFQMQEFMKEKEFFSS